MKIYRVPRGMERQIQTILFSRGYRWRSGQRRYITDRMAAIRVTVGIMTYFPIEWKPESYEQVEDLLTFNDYYEAT